MTDDLLIEPKQMTAFGSVVQESATLIQGSCIEESAPLQLLNKYPSLLAVREQLLSHPLYGSINTIEQLRAFMEDHVFAVWDFMTLTKRLQTDLTCVTLPWLPPADAALARFINEIVLCEESDEGLGGKPVSHLELYIMAMKEVGADDKPFMAFMNGIKSGKSMHSAFDGLSVPNYVQNFVLRSVDVATKCNTIEVAADFLYGREDIIPEMFERFLTHWDHVEKEAVTFKYYLERHIEVDGDSHGPMGHRMLQSLAANSEENWKSAAFAAQSAIEARIELWNGTLTKLRRVYQ